MCSETYITLSNETDDEVSNNMQTHDVDKLMRESYLDEVDCGIYREIYHNRKHNYPVKKEIYICLYSNGFLNLPSGLCFDKVIITPSYVDRYDN